MFSQNFRGLSALLLRLLKMKSALALRNCLFTVLSFFAAIKSFRFFETKALSKATSRSWSDSTSSFVNQGGDSYLIRICLLGHRVLAQLPHRDQLYGVPIIFTYVDPCLGTENDHDVVANNI